MSAERAPTTARAAERRGNRRMLLAIGLWLATIIVHGWFGLAVLCSAMLATIATARWWGYADALRDLNQTEESADA